MFKNLKSLRFSFFLPALALAAATPLGLSAQHEVDTSADRGPIRISGNENAFGHSMMADMAIMQELQDVNRYQREEMTALVEALALREGVPTEFILPTPGSGPVLMMAAMAWAKEGKNIITVEPGYLQLTRTFKEFGGDVKSIPLDENLVHDLDAMYDAIDENTVMIYICNPNNPTGTIVDAEKLEAFIKSVPDDIVVFVDEAYLELAPGGLLEHSVRPLVQQGENIIIARTFSKVWGLAGMRVGYAVAKPEYLDKMRRYYMGGPSKLACVAATASLQDQAFFEESKSRYIATRKTVTDRLDELGIEYADPNGSFVFIKTGIPVEDFQAKMRERNIMVGRPFPPLTEWARVSIGTEEEMDIFLQEFEDLMRSEGKLAMN